MGNEKFIHSAVTSLLNFRSFPQREGILMRVPTVLHHHGRGGSSSPEAHATELFIEWKSPKISEFVGVANLATRSPRNRAAC